MAITFVLDISHHQDLSLDLAATRADGCEAVFMKAGEGASMVDDAFVRNLAEARAAGQLVAAYWYQKANATAAAHVERIKATVPTAVPLILDVEINSGDTALTRDIIARLNAAGYRTPLLYIPRWYWQSLGSPSLAGLPPLWSSRYPNNKVGLLASEWTEIPASYWTGYGGLDVAVLQFTSSAKIAGYSPLDASAFRGTRDKLAALLGYSIPNPQEDDVSMNNFAFEPSAERQFHHTTIETRSKSAVVGDVWFSLSSGYQDITDLNVFLNGVTAPYHVDTVKKDTRWWVAVPDGCESISWEYNCTGPTGAAIVYSGR